MTTAIKERPIIMQADMVRAVLEGRKTQTRRVVKPQPQIGLQDYWLWEGGKPLEDAGYGARYIHSERHAVVRAMEQCCPYGRVGDRLWVREAWAHQRDATNCPDDGGVLYRATDPGWDDNATGLRWRPSIHMPRWASRITLEITDVRVQRVQEITHADIQAEGALPAARDWRKVKHVWGKAADRACFVRLWDSINDHRGYGWDSNPWVWAVTFRRVEGER